jgi:hypothetical protein
MAVDVVVLEIELKRRVTEYPYTPWGDCLKSQGNRRDLTTG